ncbi:MAG: hypothetical protein JW774_06605 [Candidatus Aureabacteria bacterium]|nr:hypothetical protein [Candidatus Auribacterota bacterium]
MRPLQLRTHEYLLFQARNENFQRHLVHEMTHAFICDFSDSRKILGEHNNLLNVPAWFNEGATEFFSYRITRNKRHEKAFNCDIDLKTIHLFLKDLNHPNREAAFYHSTNLMKSFIKLPYPQPVIPASNNNCRGPHPIQFDSNLFLR